MDSKQICGFNGCPYPVGHAVHIEQLCGRQAANCICFEKKGHTKHGEKYHRCDCGAEWRYQRRTGEPILHKWPKRMQGYA